MYKHYDRINDSWLLKIHVCYMLRNTSCQFSIWTRKSETVSVIHNKKGCSLVGHHEYNADHTLSICHVWVGPAYSGSWTWTEHCMQGSVIKRCWHRRGVLKTQSSIVLSTNGLTINGFEYPCYRLIAFFLEGEWKEWDIWATHELCISDDITLSARITGIMQHIIQLTGTVPNKYKLYVSKSFALFHMAP